MFRAKTQTAERKHAVEKLYFNNQSRVADAALESNPDLIGQVGPERGRY
jgi:hypothetical protein